MNKGFLSFILHAHLPYVRHPEHDSFFEEIWLFEAMTESYIPLINMLDHLAEDKAPFHLTLSLSPTLISMLTDDLLQSRYQQHLIKQIKLAEKEINRTRLQPEVQKLSRLYRRFFIRTQDTYKKYQNNLILAFKKHHQLGHLELITTAATHGFLPLLNINQSSIKNQIEIGLNVFESNFGFTPLGFWLPECGYYPNLESSLADAGIKYFFTDTHGITDASSAVSNSVYAPINCGNGVMAFARDPETSQQVWSADSGYPGNPTYREYYSDIGFELNQEYLAPYLVDGNIRMNTGIKYHRITGKVAEKAFYNPKKAQLAVELDAQDFISKCQKHIDQLSLTMDIPPIIIAPYDAELFGHWWFEGPSWLESVFRLASKENNNFKMVSCSDYLKLEINHQVATPAASTWGHDGDSSYWINDENDWIYPFIHGAADEMEQLAIDFEKVTVSSLQKRALNQAARSLLLAQASDWPFIMKSGTTTEYAKKSITDHLARFNYLHESIRKNKIDEHYLLALETMDNIFPDIDYRCYTRKRAPLISYPK